MMPFTIVGIFLSVVMAVLITMSVHASNTVALLIGVACGLTFTSIGLFMDSRR